MASYDGITGGRKDCLLSIGAKVLHDTGLDGGAFASKMKQLTGLEFSAKDYKRLRIDSAKELGKKINPGKSYSPDMLVVGKTGYQSKEIAQARAEISDFLNRIENRSAAAVVRHLIKSGGLVNVAKRGIFDPAGNVVNALRLEFARAPAWLVNHLFIPSKAGLIDTPFFSRGFTTGIKSAFSKGLKESWQVLKSGKIDEGKIQDNWLTKFNQPGELVWGGDAGTFAANIGLRMTRAIDRPGFWFQFDRSMVEQAKYLSKQIGKAEGWDKARIAKEYDFLLKNPTEEMVLKATEMADEAVFQNPNNVAEVASKAKQVLRESKAGEGADMVAEALFSGWRYPHIPSNVAGAGIEPLLGGGVGEASKLAWRAIRGQLKNMSNDELSHVLMLLGKKSTGAAAIATGYYLYQNGTIEPIYHNYGSKKVMVGVRVAGTDIAIPAEEIGGALMWLGFGVTIAEEASNPDGGAVGTAARLGSEGYLQQLSTVGAAEQLSALSEGSPESIKRSLARGATKAVMDIVPGTATVTDVARRSDTPGGYNPFSMEQTEGRKPVTWEEYIYERWPVLRQRVGKYD